MILPSKMVKDEKKDTDTPDKKNKHKPREGKTGNRPAKEDTDRRMLAMASACNWKKLSPGHHLVQSPAKNRINNNYTTPDDTKPPKDTNQTIGTREWKILKIFFQRKIVPETSSHVNANIIELVST
ncbi:unnamed protein product [Lactuca saligna]|uniref:Uncharacterized protein n=1 Tax=Lactuca saligna TaxID=75948 RepID=A0AA36E2J6_LACSI|nr:unnamed protein product [Lactuca saligna]